MILHAHILVIRFVGALFLCIVAFPGRAQESQSWVGTWEMHYRPWPHIEPIHVSLRIADPVADMLYPAQLTLTHGQFIGAYELLLVKKNDQQLGIGRNKVPVQEAPFGLGPWMMYLNGVFDYRFGDSGDQILLSRLWIGNFGVFMSGLYENEFYTNTKAYIRDFLYQGEVLLNRVERTPWEGENSKHIVHHDSLYYGVYDPIRTTSPVVSFSVQDEERYDQDTVTIVHNGRMIAKDLPIEKAMELESLTLDTGENYIAFFADNYGALPPNTANFILGTTDDEAGLYSFNFSAPANAYGTVMVARFQYDPPFSTEQIPQPVRTSDRRDMLMGTWAVKTEKIQLEIWDGQIEDGDIISVQVNGAKVADKLMVTKAKQRFGVSLRPGNNRILFRAENLGRIPPNTAVLRVIAQGEEKTFQLNTDFERNNVLHIVLEP